MLNNLLLFMLGVCIGYTIISCSIMIIKRLWYNKWYNKKIEQLMTTKLSYVHFSEH